MPGLSKHFINCLFLHYALLCSTGIPRAAILQNLQNKQSNGKKKRKKKKKGKKENKEGKEEKRVS